MHQARAGEALMVEYPRSSITQQLQQCLHPVPQSLVIPSPIFWPCYLHFGHEPDPNHRMTSWMLRPRPLSSSSLIFEIVCRPVGVHPALCRPGCLWGL